MRTTPRAASSLLTTAPTVYGEAPAGIPAPAIAVIKAGLGRTGTASLKLASAHPDAKVIFTVRDPDRWYDSIQSTIFSLLQHLAETGGESLPGDIILERTFAHRTDDGAHVLAVFAAHTQAVREALGSDRLLVFDVKQGWDPLCAFLGVPVPDDKTFPHLNDTAEFQADERKRIE